MRRKPEFGHDLPRFLGHHEQVVHDVLGLARELLAQHRVLRGDADRTGVQVALAHHDAAQRDQRGGRESHFLGAQQRRDDDVAARADAAVRLQHHAAAQVVEHQCLVRFGDPQLPRQARVLDARQRRRAGATHVAGDQDVIGVRLGHAGGHGADPRLRDQLDADARFGIGVLQVVDQLGQVLDRIDVVVRRRADQAHAGRRIADAGDRVVDLAARQLAPLARLGALRHLDLQFVRVAQVPGRHAETARGDLLDGRAFRVAVGQRQEPRRILAPFSRIAAATDAIHGHGQRLVGLAGNRAETHRARAEPLDDVGGRLHFVQRHRVLVGGPAESQQAAQRAATRRVGVDVVRKPPVGLAITRARGDLQTGDRIGVPDVRFTAGPPVKLAGVRQHGKAILRAVRIAAGVSPHALRWPASRG